MSVDENFLTFHLSHVKLPVQFDVARKAGYDGKKERRTLFEFFKQKTKEQIEELFEEYVYSARTTNHLFVLNDSSEDLIKFFIGNFNILNKLQKQNQKPPGPYDTLYYVDKVKYFESTNELRFIVRIVKMRAILESYDETTGNEGYIRFNKIETIPVRLYLPERLLVVRCGGSSFANIIIKKLSELDSHFSCHKIDFNKENKESVINHILVRNSSFRFGDDETGAETLKISVGVDKKKDEIRDAKKTKRFEDAKKEGKINYVTVSIAREFEEESTTLHITDDILTFLINFNDSKVFFNNFMYEDEIKDRLLYIIEKCNLDITKSKGAGAATYQADVDQILE